MRRFQNRFQKLFTTPGKGVTVSKTIGYFSCEKSSGAAYDTLSETREQVPDGWKGRFCHNLSIASLCGVDHPSTVFWWNIDSFSGYGSLYFSRPFFVKESMIRRNSFSDVKWSVDLEKTLFEVGHHWRNRWKSRKMMFFCHLEKKYH